MVMWAYKTGLGYDLTDGRGLGQIIAHTYELRMRPSTGKSCNTGRKVRNVCQRTNVEHYAPDFTDYKFTSNLLPP